MPIDPDHVAELCPELRALLDAELAVGNQIVETSKGWPIPTSIFVLLASPFRIVREVLPHGVTYLDVNDPHWWKSEYNHFPSGHKLACRMRH
jgi:hypothetical protein